MKVLNNKRNARQWKYIVKGEPIHLISSTYLKNKEWNEYKQEIVKFEITLESQHKGPLIKGPVAIEVKFYLDPNYKTESKKSDHHENLTNLIKFIEEAGKEVLFSNNCTIHELNASKFYSKENRTEIIIKEIDYLEG